MVDTMHETMLKQAAELRVSWDNLRREQPKLRIRDAAAQLGVSEVELLATGVGTVATRLRPEWGAIIAALPELGDVMALTRNQHAVHERKGRYRNISVEGTMGLVLDEEIDLRIFLSHWHFGFAVREPLQQGERRSVQFFDRDGTAVHKVYAGDECAEAYDALVARFADDDQLPYVPVSGPSPKPEVRDIADIDFDGLYSDWRSLQDTHHFHPMLLRHRVTRLQAFGGAPAELAHQVPTSALETLLRAASEHGTEIMVFVGSPGVIQIHTGSVERIVETGPWINVLDPRFNLHLRQDAVDTAWVVRKPTADGVVTSLELFDADGGTIAMLFGKRKPGMPELEAWRALIQLVETPVATVAAGDM